MRLFRFAEVLADPAEAVPVSALELHRGFQQQERAEQLRQNCAEELIVPLPLPGHYRSKMFDATATSYLIACQEAQK